MLLYACTTDDDLNRLQEGMLADIRLWPTLDAARAVCGDGLLLIVDGSRLDVRLGDEGGANADVPRAAVLNLDPYLPPKPVTAGGGYVVRRTNGEPEVLLIYRRGFWDLPKGKHDPGEHIEACALREVREEVGIDEALHVMEPLGVTVHGYAEKGFYRVKTTHWFLMQTSQRRFTPQEDEGIEQVAWVPWSEAKRRIGFETLRRHMQTAEARVLGAARGGGAAA